MRAVLVALITAFSAPTWCNDDILGVLQRSQQMQLDALSAAEVDPASPAARVVQQSFERVLTVLKMPVEVR